MGLRTGAQALVETLECQGVTRIFCVPGESYLAVLDALRDSPIETVVARQEGGAAMMAEADAKLTGRPGVVFVTRGPGAANASAGVHVAQQDSTPLVLFAGQVARAARGRDAFQEVDFPALFGGMAKSVSEVVDAEQLPAVVGNAFRTALADRPGPTVVALPEDMLTDPCTAPALRRVDIPAGQPDVTAVERFDAMLSAAARPLVVVGGSLWDTASVARLRTFAEAAGVPVACGFRRQHLFDHTHGHYAGDVGIGLNPRLRQALEETDLLVLLGFCPRGCGESCDPPAHRGVAGRRQHRRAGHQATRQRAFPSFPSARRAPFDLRSRGPRRDRQRRGSPSDVPRLVVSNSNKPSCGNRVQYWRQH